MKYVFQIGEKGAEVQCSDHMTIDELEVVKEMMSKMIDTQIKEEKYRAQNRLPLTADIDSLYPELSVRARNILKRSGCNTIEDVLNNSYSDLKRMRNMGKSTFEEIKERFEKYGTFKDSEVEE